MGLSEDVTAELAKAVWGAGGARRWRRSPPSAGLEPRATAAWRMACALAEELPDFPRHLATHVGGFVITRGPLVGTRRGHQRRHGRPHTPSNGTRTTSTRSASSRSTCWGSACCPACAAPSTCFARHGGPELDLASVPRDCPETYAMLRRADSLGVFQVESRAQMNMLPRLRPDVLLRPGRRRWRSSGPARSRATWCIPTCAAKSGEEPAVPYPSPSTAADERAVLGKTLGVPLFQEQAMRIAIVAAGFSPEEADELRRAMATFKPRRAFGGSASGSSTAWWRRLRARIRRARASGRSRASAPTASRRATPPPSPTSPTPRPG